MNASLPPPPSTHRDLLTRWETYAELSRQLARFDLTITGMGVSRWAQNDSIPSEYWDPVATLADEAGIIGFTACLKMLASHSYESERAKRASAASDAEASV